MAEETLRGYGDLLRQLTWPVAAVVAAVVGVAWYVTWQTSDLTMELLPSPMSPASPSSVGLSFLLLVVMMVAMMLPSALPMVVTYRGLTRMAEGRPSRPADTAATVAFAASYFIVWGAFAVAALAGLMAVGLLEPLSGLALLVPAAVLGTAGAYQFTRPKEACLRHCQSPVGFVMTHWRTGRTGALRMGLSHAGYCVGCCWLFMLVLFVAGAMSLIWMGALSVVIFAEKVGPAQTSISRAIGVLLLAFGVLVAAQATPSL